jgi:hypothetical protein
MGLTQYEREGTFSVRFENLLLPVCHSNRLFVMQHLDFCLCVQLYRASGSPQQDDSVARMKQVEAALENSTKKVKSIHLVMRWIKFFLVFTWGSFVLTASNA